MVVSSINEDMRHVSLYTVLYVHLVQSSRSVAGMNKLRRMTARHPGQDVFV